MPTLTIIAKRSAIISHLFHFLLRRKRFLVESHLVWSNSLVAFHQVAGACLHNRQLLFLFS